MKIVKPHETRAELHLKQMIDRTSQNVRSRLRAVAEELAGRKREALKVYQAMPYQERYHKCTEKEVILRAGNRTGKSLAGFVETARVLTGQDPHDKYPKEGGTAVCVGFKESHIGMVIYPYLFKPGAFRMVFDTTTEQWRPWFPKTDKANGIHYRDTIPSPPLVPDRFIENFIWEKRGQNIIRRVDFTTGWELHCFSSRGMPVQGFAADYFHIDEDLERYDWYEETLPRLVDRGGKLRWTALPHAKNEALVSVVERAEDEKTSFANGGPEPSTVDIHATIYDNIHLDPKEVEEVCKRWRQLGEDVYRKRALGELVNDSHLVYPTFSKSMHNAMIPAPGMSRAREIFIESMETNGYPPRDWMRSFILDPGHAFCAGLMIATPPPALGLERFVYDELYLQKATAKILATSFQRKYQGFQFQRFIIDAHGGALTSSETGLSPRSAYSREFAKLGIYCEETAEHFQSGSDDIAGREELLRLWMGISDSGEPTIFIHMGNCPNLVSELSRFKKIVVGEIVQDKANRRLRCHAIEALEYATADGLDYIAPRTNQVEVNRVELILRGMRDRERQRRSQGYTPGAQTVSLGPPE